MPAVNLISNVPPFASAEEHATIIGSTPNSFTEIPAVLKHKEENVSVTFEPPLEGFASAAVQGTLYVLTSVLAFMPTSGHGFQIEYPAITLHAVSRGDSGPSIYCQLDETIGGISAVPNNGAILPDGEENEQEDSDMRELTIVPQTPSSLESIFEALSHCASLHPDPLDSEDELGGEGDADAFVDSSNFETFNGDEAQELSEVGRAALEYMESIIDDPRNLVPQTLGEDEEKDALDDAEELDQPNDVPPSLEETHKD
ncbi:regulator of volume decrease after cellular swelling-domain-containing protein [Crepidotus variabilis]|uniref:Regulator of volume decrease after cellular swelling-domain-containing protein n=1 Tax=Crepidotus variabilis TaxID=179855 RepID=A0A9P6ECM7_9AGAR|nr:regulator of volume decrease after cellular swelling-domain-containing protein [Crepidotus variabilis]